MALMTSLPLTLIGVVLVTYCYMDDLAQWFKRQVQRQSACSRVR